MASHQPFKLSAILFALTLVLTLVHAAALENRREVETARENHWYNVLPFLKNPAPVPTSDNAAVKETENVGKYQHVIIPQTHAPASVAAPATTLEKRAPLPTELARDVAMITPSTTYSTYRNCTTTFYLWPTPPLQPGPKFTVWYSTATETVYYDCSGCYFAISSFPATSTTHFHRTTTISSILTFLTPTCYDPPAPPWATLPTIFAEETAAPKL